MGRRADARSNLFRGWPLLLQDRAQPTRVRDQTTPVSIKMIVSNGAVPCMYRTGPSCAPVKGDLSYSLSCTAPRMHGTINVWT